MLVDEVDLFGRFGVWLVQCQHGKNVGADNAPCLVGRLEFLTAEVEDLVL